MSLDSLLKFISSSSSRDNADSDLAFAEVSESGRITSINPFGRLAWGWRNGTELSADLKFALECLDGDEPVELPLTMGGLHLRGMRTENETGWFLIGYEPDEESSTGDQFSFRALMDQIPQPALCLNTTGLAWYVNAAAAKELGQDASELTGRPALAEIINPEDRWKLAELMELAARDGSSHASIRFGRHSRLGVLHLVQSVKDEFQAVLLPVSENDDLIDGSYVQESFYQSFLEQGPVGVLYLDATGTVTFENHCFRSLVGENPEASWLGLRLAEIAALPGDTATKLLRVCENGETLTFTADLLDLQTGKVGHHVQIHASGIRHPEGHIIGAALLVEDRTELVKHERELELIQESERVRNTLRELAMDDQNPASFRDQAVTLLGSAVGAASASLMGLSVGKDRFVEIAHWNFSGTPSPGVSFQRSELESFESLHFGTHLHCAEKTDAAICSHFDANSCWIDPVRDNGQFAGHFVFSFVDDTWDDALASPSRINEFVRLFEALYSRIQLAARYRNTVAAIDDALFGFSLFKNGGRRFHFATAQFELLTGYHPSELLDDTHSRIDWVNDIVHKEDASLVRAHNKTLQDGHESRVTYRVHHRDGTIRWLREHATPRTDATGMTAVNGILSDVSEQKAAELVLLQAKKEAEASDESKTAFIATLSHEIRTPMGAVNGFAQILEKELEEFEEELPYDLPEQVHEFVTAISERSQKLLTLVDDLFELSNIEMGKATLERRELDLAGIIRASVEKSRAAIERKGIDLNLNLRAATLKVRADKRRLAHVFDNLLSNATKFTETGSIRVDVSQSTSQVKIEIIDTGIGISEEYREKLFDSFTQEEDWRNRRFEGTGLGLTLVKRLVEMMGGAIEVESVKAKGSTFRVTLPLIVRDDDSHVPSFLLRTGRSS